MLSCMEKYNIVLFFKTKLMMVMCTFSYDRERPTYQPIEAGESPLAKGTVEGSDTVKMKKDIREETVRAR